MAKIKNRYTWKIGEEDEPIIDSHSLIKLEIIEEYLEIYLKTLTQHRHMKELKLTIIDGFSGGGIYRFENRKVEGSPLIVLKTINKSKIEINFGREQKKLKPINFNIKSIFIEKNRDTFDFLIKTLKDRNLDSNPIKTIHGKFQNNIDNIIKLIKKDSKRKNSPERAIFILDQYGYSDASIVEVNKIFRNLNNAEVILTFSVDALIDYLSERTIPILNKTMAFTKQDIEYLFDTKKDNDKNRKLLQYIFYKAIVTKVGAKFYTPFFIKSDKTHRAYWLFHFSSHSKARDEMIKLHWNKENTFKHYGRAGLNMLGYDSNCNNSLFAFDSLAKQESINSLEKEIPKIIYSYEDGVVFENLKNDILNFTPATIDMIKESLENEIHYNDIIISSKDDNIRKKSSTIKNDDIIKAKKYRQKGLF